MVRVNPRDVWANEATNFTPWLRDNIDYLAEAVGISIQLVESEVTVGDFSVDLVGEEPGESRPVIIENQLERTNHTHLGQLLTYAAGKDGGVIIWGVPRNSPGASQCAGVAQRSYPGQPGFLRGGTGSITDTRLRNEGAQFQSGCNAKGRACKAYRQSSPASRRT